jgi:peptidoglycan biosynthesis protein MviN/MurJ (putative lipid II flippase)
LKKFSLNKLNALQLFQLLRFGSIFLSSVVLAKLLPDQHQIGIYETLTLLGTSFSFFWVSGLINSFIPFYHSQESEGRKKLISSIFVSLSGLSLIFTLLIWVVANRFFDLQGGLLKAYLLFSLFNAPAFLTEYLLLVRNRLRPLSLYAIFNAAGLLGCIFFPLYAGYSLTEAVGCLAAFSLLKYIGLCFIVYHEGSPRLDRTLLLAFFKKATPIILGLMLGGSMPYIDSYIVRWFRDTATFAVYQYGAREMPLVLLMANAFSNVISGDISEGHRISRLGERLAQLKQKSKRLMHLLFPMTIVLMLGSKFLFLHFYSAAFLPSVLIFNIFLLLSINRLIFPQSVLLGLQQNKILLRISIIEWTINLLADFVFFYFFGLQGIAYATVAAFSMERLIQVIYLRQRHHISPAQYLPWKTWLLYSMACVITFAVSFYL